MAAVGLIVIALTCGGFFGYNWYVNRPVEPVAEAAPAEFEDAKTDFISIAVFEEGSVQGYVSFRAELSVKSADLAPEASYLIADTIHRKLSVFSKIIGKQFKPKDAKLIEEPLLASLQDRLGKDQIASIKLVDIGYDKRIQQ